jgi:dTDP-4-amino-4,6-dideoxygalactose transaminase
MNSRNRIPFNKPSIVGREFFFLEEAFERGQLSGDGHFTKECNARIAELTGSAAALLTHSCTAALEMAAILCDLKPGDEVIMPSFTFVSTANAVVLRGATPVFVDIDPQSLNLDPNLVEAAITPRTRAIFAVHYAGFPAEMDSLNEIAREQGLIVIEDAAQALGSTYKGRQAGSLADMAAFSFHETKNIISGEGGAITVNRSDLVERAEIIREKGTNRSRFLRGQVDKYTWVDIGSSFLPGELVAAFLFAQLEQETVIRQSRLALFDQYKSAFADFEQRERVTLPWHSDHVTGNGHMFYLLMRDIDDRDALISHLREAGIIAPFHYVPLHSAPGGRRFARVAGDLPITDATHSRLVRLPLFFTLGDEIERVIDVTRAWLGANA